MSCSYTLNITYKTLKDSRAYSRAVEQNTTHTLKLNVTSTLVSITGSLSMSVCERETSRINPKLLYAYLSGLISGSVSCKGLTLFSPSENNHKGIKLFSQLIVCKGQLFVFSMVTLCSMLPATVVILILRVWYFCITYHPSTMQLVTSNKTFCIGEC